MKEFDRRGLHRPWGTKQKQTTKTFIHFNQIQFIFLKFYSQPMDGNEKQIYF
jgi:hypothetical protein